METECNACCCMKCHDYSCSVWRCMLECRDVKDPIEDCDFFTLQNPDYREGDGEEWL